MRFRKQSPNVVAKETINRSIHWQVWFAWRPVRIDETTLAWLEHVARKERQFVTITLFKSKDFVLLKRTYEYGPASFALTQPGVFDGSAGVSQAQAGSPAVQSGSASVAGNTGPLILGSGGPPASHPTPRGLNAPAPQSWP